MSRRAAMIGLTVAPVAIGLIWKVASHPVAAFVASRFGARLLRMSDGKFTDPQRFIEMRLTDFAVLSAGICLIVLAHILIVWLINLRISSRYHWIASAISVFICLNVSALLAAHTALFWCALFSGKNRSHNYTQYEIKSLLLKECPTPAQALLIGNSQTKAQIDPGLINARLGSRLWTTELHFPGSRPYDVDLSFSKLPNTHPQFVVCYVTEGYFYSGADSEGLIYFQNWRDLPEYYSLGGASLPIGQHFLFGLLGDTIPLFRLREPITARLLGFHLLNLPQERYNGALNSDLAQRAVQAAQAYHFGDAAEFEKKGFATLAQSCRASGARLILCVGQMNPVFGRTLDPAMRPDMLRFLRQLASDDPNIILLDENDLPKQSESDYEDLTHCNKDAQARFSAYLGGVLDKLLITSNLAPK